MRSDETPGQLTPKVLSEIQELTRAVEEAIAAFRDHAVAFSQIEHADSFVASLSLRQTETQRLDVCRQAVALAIAHLERGRVSESKSVLCDLYSAIAVQQNANPEQSDSHDGNKLIIYDALTAEQNSSTKDLPSARAENVDADIPF